jgi:hypothetical protein
MSVPERYLVLDAIDPAGDVGWALFPLDDATLDRMRAAHAALKRLREEHPDLRTTEIVGNYAGVVFVAHTSAMQSFVADFSAATLHSALVDHLSAGEEPTVSDHHLLPSLLAPVAETAVAIGLYGDIVLRTYWSEEGDDITASTDLPTLERESRRH